MPDQKKVSEKSEKKERHTLTDAERSAKLKEIAPARMGRALRAIKHIGGVTRWNPSSHQKSAMLSALKTAVANVESQFAGKAPAAEFELPA